MKRRVRVASFQILEFVMPLSPVPAPVVAVAVAGCVTLENGVPADNYWYIVVLDLVPPSPLVLCDEWWCCLLLVN